MSAWIWTGLLLVALVLLVRPPIKFSGEANSVTPTGAAVLVGLAVARIAAIVLCALALARIWIGDSP